MSVTTFPSKGRVTPEGQADEPAARYEAAPQTVISLKGYRQELTRKARAQVLREMRGKVKAPSLTYVLLAVFFAGTAALAYGHNYFDISDAARSGLVVGSMCLLAWIYHAIFLGAFFTLHAGMLLVFGSTYFFEAIMEVSIVLVGIVLTTLFMKWIGLLE
ncbi:hypothetical protein CEP88_00190 (plasmid) [Roseobacter denitrificans]|uniref:Uncharacterized protein n=1 Tax=Roseobacter denitrificans (strain ATCC 33942 / OCh 114) TaxID=375451 RepID=Q07GS7_ROSDO|nr:hypothetical protein [Roseobacter denitrificans]ABI93322.1 hypothetical protein RD1_A0018 [Roseobacter denitrificans OCh 114]AVL51215.1 hypothetical protein CEP88_00190 [Roseobacter denitrificans]SFG40695.1 hypothetical protein SAMN05443635_11627 [Roseobacter denitrificans OCh 114]